MVEKQDLHVFVFPAACLICCPMVKMKVHSGPKQILKIVLVGSRYKSQRINMTSAHDYKNNKMGLVVVFLRLAALISLDWNHIFKICKLILLDLYHVILSPKGFYLT